MDNTTHKVETTTTTTTTSNGGFMDHLKDIAHHGKDYLNKGWEFTKEKANESYEYSKEKASEGFQFSKEKVGEFSHAINESLPEKLQYHPDGTVKTTETKKVHENLDGSKTVEHEKTTTVHDTKV
ncbi:hypothetical protein DICPUDRAFT_54918 [Dictyostelium purpureum]|uniref:Uncharacterized protein n=1 Tax=Dictyostelium purpureum TaxID=5786 RepID=F0ZJI7_DICPU|nr:uncharacterized protein DICPUDRAFT_54918 [Dictyostelium purpureum]EGC35907.1 hypothetical protein DICPUDRAFT_54918 [Dictyostelium purpureum]|eukprot:XP_003287561.1 hypothetical protein DICPUDRAFT_54918 [Dictyostelium purpureum]